MENTVIQHRPTFLKFDQSKKNRFSIKTPEPQIKETNSRSGEKNSSCNTSLTTAELRHMHYNFVCDVTNRTVFIMSSRWMI